MKNLKFHGYALKMLLLWSQPYQIRKLRLKITVGGPEILCGHEVAEYFQKLLKGK